MPTLPPRQRRTRPRLALAPALIAAILALAACTAADPPPPEPTAVPTAAPVSAAVTDPTAPPTAAAKPASSPTPTVAPTPTPTPTNTPARPTITIDLNIANRAAGLARQDLQVKRGDTVSLHITSDEPGEIHLHGYNLTAPVAPDAPGKLTFQAHTAGAFGINFHAFSPLPSDGNGNDGNGAMRHWAIESEIPVSVGVVAVAEADGGVNIAINTDNWQWTPEQVNSANVAGAGHAHIYVDGVKINRVYGPYYHIQGLPPGDREIRVTLNANDHRELLVDGRPIAATAAITVPDAGRSHAADPEPVAAADPMSVDIIVDSDPDGGYNLNVIPAGFAFAGANANQPHTPGVWEGHAYVDIDGVNHARLYEPWLKLPALAPGAHTITVRLAANDRRPYYHDGQPVAASIPLDVEDTDGAGHDSHGHSHGSSHSHGDGGHDTPSAREIIAEVHLGNLEVYP